LYAIATDPGTIAKVQGFGFSMKIWGFTVSFRAGRKTRNSLTRSTRLLMARLELDSLYNEPARFLMSQLEPTREPLASHNKPSKLSRKQLKLVRHLWPIHHLQLGPAQLRTLTLSAAQPDFSVRDPLPSRALLQSAAAPHPRDLA
jgi:hypothetical protein